MTLTKHLPTTPTITSPQPDGPHVLSMGAGVDSIAIAVGCVRARLPLDSVRDFGTFLGEVKIYRKIYPDRQDLGEEGVEDKHLTMLSTIVIYKRRIVEVLKASPMVPPRLSSEFQTANQLPPPSAVT